MAPVQPLDAKGSVEVWLAQVEMQMKFSVKAVILASIPDYAEKDRNLFVVEWVGQVLLRLGR